MSQASPAQALSAGNEGVRERSTADVQYVNPARMETALKVMDALAFLASLTVLFNMSLRFLSQDAALMASGFLAAEVTYLCVIALRWIRIYDTDFLIRFSHGLLAACGVTTFVGGAALLFANTFLFPLPPGSPLAWLGVMAVYFAISRGAASLWARPLAESGAFRQRIAIVGGDDNAASVIDALETSDDIDVEILGFFDSRDDVRSPPVVRGHNKLGRISDIHEFCARNRVDLVIVAIPMTAHQRLMKLLPKLWRLPVDVRISGQAIDMKLSPRAYTFLGKLPLLTVFSRPLGNKALRTKTLMDKIISAAFITILSPLLVLTGLAVLLTSRGSLLIHEKHIGFDGKPINLLRFRTRQDVETADGEEAPYTLIGRWLEQGSLHESPEMFNVLKGDLSIVGPAIHDHHRDEIGLYERVADSYCQRHGLKPGLIGWAQIHGFGDNLDTIENIENRVKYDLEYVDRFSWTFDLRILVKTPFAWLRSKSPQYVV
jgi:lipopolysaccharide/colanic/teichoic acid biosynthesis glycosyltransferase